MPLMAFRREIWFEPLQKAFSQIFPSARRDYTLVIRRVEQSRPSTPTSLQMTSCSNNAISVVSYPGSFSLGLTQLCIYQCNCQELEALILSIRRISILLRAEGLSMYGPHLSVPLHNYTLARDRVGWWSWWLRWYWWYRTTKHSSNKPFRENKSETTKWNPG